MYCEQRPRARGDRSPSTPHTSDRSPSTPHIAMVLHLLCALSTAALHPSSVMHRRDALLAAASAGSIATGNLRPAFADDAVVKLSQKQIEGKLSKVPAIALVNEEDQPYFTNGRVGYFFLDPTVRESAPCLFLTPRAAILPALLTPSSRLRICMCTSSSPTGGAALAPRPPEDIA